MTFNQILQITQMMGSVTVVVSLVFVCIQLRRNARYTQAASHHAVSEALNKINLLWAGDGDVSRLWLTGLEDRDGLTPVECWRFDSTLRAYLHICETMFWQARLGAGDAGIVSAEENGIRFVLSSDGARSWWIENPFGFSPAFRNYVERMTGLS